jgi:ribose-phosphate pyrophosphokinase
LFRRALERHLARPVSFALVEKFRSDEGIQSGASSGDIAGRVAILLDDLVSTGTTLVRAAEACRQKGARAVYAAATHGVLAADAPRLLRDSPIERITLLDTIPARPGDASQLEGRLEMIDCAPLLARAIHRLHTNDPPESDDG